MSSLMDRIDPQVLREQAFLLVHFGMNLSKNTSERSSDGDGEVRTLDPLLARQVLSQLSYIPKELISFNPYVSQPAPSLRAC